MLIGKGGRFSRFHLITILFVSLLLFLGVYVVFSLRGSLTGKVIQEQVDYISPINDIQCDTYFSEDSCSGSLDSSLRYPQIPYPEDFGGENAIDINGVCNIYEMSDLVMNGVTDSLNFYILTSYCYNGWDVFYSVDGSNWIDVGRLYNNDCGPVWLSKQVTANFNDNELNNMQVKLCSVMDEVSASNINTLYIEVGYTGETSDAVDEDSTLVEDIVEEEIVEEDISNLGIDGCIFDLPEKQFTMFQYNPCRQGNPDSVINFSLDNLQEESVKEYQVLNNMPISGSPLVINNQVYIGVGNYLQIFDYEDMSLLNELDLEGGIESVPVYKKINDIGYLFVSLNNGDLVKVNIYSLEIEGRLNFCKSESSPVITNINGRDYIYLSTGCGQIYQVDAESFTKVSGYNFCDDFPELDSINEYRCRHDIYQRSSPVVGYGHDGKPYVFVGFDVRDNDDSMKSYLYRLDAVRLDNKENAKGRLLEPNSGGLIMIKSTPLLSMGEDGRMYVYIGTTGWGLFKLNSVTMNIESYIDLSGPVYGGFGFYNGDLYTRVSNYLVKIDSENMVEEARSGYLVGNDFNGAPLVIENSTGDINIFIGGNNIYQLDGNLNLIGQFNEEGLLTADFNKNLAIGYNAVYAGSSKGRVYRIGECEVCDFTPISVDINLFDYNPECFEECSEFDSGCLECCSDNIDSTIISLIDSGLSFDNRFVSGGFYNPEYENIAYHLRDNVDYSPSLEMIEQEFNYEIEESLIGCSYYLDNLNINTQILDNSINVNVNSLSESFNYPLGRMNDIKNRIIQKIKERNSIPLTYATQLEDESGFIINFGGYDLNNFLVYIYDPVSGLTLNVAIEKTNDILEVSDSSSLLWKIDNYYEEDYGDLLDKWRYASGIV